MSSQVTRVLNWPPATGTQSTFAHSLSLLVMANREGPGQNGKVAEFVLDGVCRLSVLFSSHLGFPAGCPLPLLQFHPFITQSGVKGLLREPEALGEICDEAGLSPWSWNLDQPRAGPKESL